MTNSDTTFIWPSWIAIGHRSIDSLSSNIRKNIDSLLLILADEQIIDVFGDKEVLDEIDRMVLVCAAAGTFSGTRYDLPSGYVVAAAVNAPNHLTPDDPTKKKAKTIKDGMFKGASLEIDYGKVKLTCSIDEIMSLCFLLSKIVIESTSVTIMPSSKEPPKPVVKTSQEDIIKLYKK